MLYDALHWIRSHSRPGEGLALGSRHPEPSPEVTAYAIPTLLAVGERELAAQYARWLVRAQQADGAFGGDAAETGYAFDTAQAVRGWIAILDELSEVEEPLRRACDWLVAHAEPGTGRLPVPRPGAAWNLGWRGEISEAIHLYCLAPLQLAGHALGDRRYHDLASRARDHYLRLPLDDFAPRNALSHCFGLVQEALLELGCDDVARRGLAAVWAAQQRSGAIPAYADVTWVCAPGIAQLAAVWYALGEREPADRALAFLARLQNPGGGFFGSYGIGADYFPAEEVAWAAKFAIDACLRRDAAARTAAAPAIPNSMDAGFVAAPVAAVARAV